ncbi:succinate dehydrogenase [Parachlamydia sp. AcF125]|uniref:succinate dehydrogenase n=1 Tax=Parachlamydia sp. AcF125 TaxID=2795736 RepID=UPI001BC94DE7|nr:succinate dehydrogenase [Parachlamydia sp. AcF125]MBS4167815.1 Succinate dehydrogenase cytochrome b558 subunit [Parachlamydia sp. AcF125]
MTWPAQTPPQAFIWRRLHSLTGAWLSLFLIEHLLVNSQAALFIGEDGYGFVHAVNAIKNFPYLPLIELFLLGVPIFVHLVWGIKYLKTRAINSFETDGSKPSLPQYSRNHAYSWQRITSWILLFGLLAHIIHMRFIEAPLETRLGIQKHYLVRLNADKGLYTLAARLDAKLYNQEQIKIEEKAFLSRTQNKLLEDSEGTFAASIPKRIEKEGAEKEENPQVLIREQQKKQEREWLKTLKKKPLKGNEVMAVTPSFGVAELLMVRETFKMPTMIVLYTLFVLAACYHGFNGLWTFMITWGVTLTALSQRYMRYLATALMVMTAFWGMAAIWGTYWINLKN